MRGVILALGALPALAMAADYKVSSVDYAVKSSSTSTCDDDTVTETPVGYPATTSVPAKASYPAYGEVSSEAPVYTTSTICSTNVYTVTKCSEGGDEKYCPTTIYTEITPISTTVCTVTPTVTPTTYGYTTSTIYATTIHTVTSCAPDAGYCPAKSTYAVTDTYAISTTVCAITTKGAEYPGATPVPYPPKAEYPGSEYPGGEHPGAEYPGSGSEHPGAEHPGQGSHEQPAPYVPGAPTKAYTAPGSEHTGAYAPVPGKEYPGQPGTPAPYPGVAQPSTYQTGGVKPVETGYPVIAGAASLEGASKVLVAVVVGAIAML